jgi:hypothetical protein
MRLRLSILCFYELARDLFIDSLLFRILIFNVVRDLFGSGTRLRD